jgi:uncharacterized membrane-anchored protein
MRPLHALLALALACPVPAAAQAPKPAVPIPADSTERRVELKQLDASLHYKTGDVHLANGAASLRLSPAWRFLPAADAERVLTTGWGNPPGTSALGMIVPAGVSPLDSAGWGVIVTFRTDGYVKDDDAEDIDYNELMRQMQEDSRADNQERRRLGYPQLNLVGWATRPHYDAATHKLYWARELAEPGSNYRTLNYDVRVLGRRGVLSLNAVSGMESLGAVERDMQDVLRLVDFEQGHRYSDFTSGDKIAAYGIGALVAGTFAAKAGLFKVLLVGLVAAKKFLVLVFAAVVGFFRKRFGGKGSGAAST